MPINVSQTEDDGMWWAIPAAIGVASFLGGRATNAANARQAELSRDFESEQAQRQMDFQERMRNTAYQSATADMKAAGLNPMLAYSQGGAATPGGASGSAQPARMENALGQAAASAMQAASVQQQMEESESRIRVQDAEASLKNAEEEEIRGGKIPKHAAEIANLNQQVSESLERVKLLAAQTHREGATAAELQARTKKIEEEIPMVRATVENIKAHTKLSAAQLGLTEAQKKEIDQRVAQNLPALEAALLKLEAASRESRRPGEVQQEIFDDSFFGQLSVVIKNLIPLQGLFVGVGSGRGGAAVGTGDRKWPTPSTSPRGGREPSPSRSSPSRQTPSIHQRSPGNHPSWRPNG